MNELENLPEISKRRIDSLLPVELSDCSPIYNRFSTNEAERIDAFALCFSQFWQDLDEGLTKRIGELIRIKMEYDERDPIVLLNRLDLVPDHEEWNEMKVIRRTFIHHGYLSNKTIREKIDAYNTAYGTFTDKILESYSKLRNFCQEEFDI